ncbi:MAG: acyl carrier protein [Lachnospiraceae bacterium]|jgi:acyl carrier protein|nr:acyl carrier protein [Lachnospiraceae bacterium]SFT33878.1 Phosphopantetheine attachment site [Lachnospiraceae bacterium XBD2001]MBQ1608401.1 acyl carrier protein [Lachnospiraceae bacterium]MBQ1640872.1 acyl carrier protein [Lachnospiraceae bacterium]MBQ1722041.1 acyl carrier protein [Lachnospiraceae bacterium]
MNVKEELLEILEELHPDIDFAEEEQLIDDKLLDSFDVVTLVTEIGSAFDVELTAADMVPENFNSVDAMVAMIERMMED